MAKPPKQIEAVETKPEEKKELSVVGRKVRYVELGSNAEGLGNAKTIISRNAEMTYVYEGVLAVSKKTKEEVLIPNANMKLVKFELQKKPDAQG